MDCRKKNIRGIGMSIFTKVMLSVVITLLSVIMVIEISNFYVIKKNRERAEELYQNTLDYYGGFWEDKLGMLNTSLLTLVGYESGKNFHSLLDNDNNLDVEVSKIELLKEMDDIVLRQDSRVCLFTYAPERNVFIHSSEQSWPYEVQNQINQKIILHIKEQNIENNLMWETIEVNDKYYFLKIFHMQKGYAGAIIECSQLLEGFRGEQDSSEAVFVETSDGEIIDIIGTNLAKKSVLRFEKGLNFTEVKLIVLMQDAKLYSNGSYVGVLTISTILLAFLIVLINMQFQKKTFFSPLERLKQAMEKFSAGDTNVRLSEFSGGKEIGLLYHTFNHMAEQITDLKIGIYESELEKREIQSDYLKMQIQPHFYTNNLNLIHGLAQMGEYRAIQKLSTAMATYFRYLLGEKGTFVLMKEELLCVKKYAEIQKFRYGGKLDIEIEIFDDIEEQLILPLVLQTFVENSVKHNVTLVEKLDILVTIKVKNGYLSIAVHDNGVGFEKEILEKILAGERISEKGQHIGIMNVKERVGLFYQEEAVLEINSEPGNTRVSLRLPLVLTEEERKHEYYVGR